LFFVRCSLFVVCCSLLKVEKVEGLRRFKGLL
jgi:hypothetical protein